MIRIESAPDKGSKFCVEMPVKESEVCGMAAVETRETRMARLEPGQPEYRILIVEDQAENWLLLRQLLEQAGFLVRVAENGAEGVDAFQSWRPQFIWMDWRMPVMDGMEATRRIRSLEGGHDVKIVTLSASVFKEEREQVLAALPLSLSTELTNALVSLDAPRIAGLIHRTAEINPELGNVLEHHAARLQYTIILQALQSCRSGVLKEEDII